MNCFYGGPAYSTIHLFIYLSEKHTCCLFLFKLSARKEVHSARELNSLQPAFLHIIVHKVKTLISIQTGKLNILGQTDKAQNKKKVLRFHRSFLELGYNRTT